MLPSIAHCNMTYAAMRENDNMTCDNENAMH
jgi:hypothetical protein